MAISRQKAIDNENEFKAEFVGFSDSIETVNSLRSVIVNTDEQRLMQVLLNLQTNALKFTQKGKVTIRIEVNKLDDGEYLVVRIIDTGLGIKQED